MIKQIAHEVAAELARLVRVPVVTAVTTAAGGGMQGKCGVQGKLTIEEIASLKAFHSRAIAAMNSVHARIVLHSGGRELRGTGDKRRAPIQRQRQGIAPATDE
jgi:hypothetical protein